MYQPDGIRSSEFAATCAELIEQNGECRVMGRPNEESNWWQPHPMVHEMGKQPDFHRYVVM